MNDRELLELAAKPCGIQLAWDWGGLDKDIPRRADDWKIWNPLTDDGDAFRLAVELGVAVYTGENWARAQIPNEPVFEEFAHEDFQDIFAATRKVITRAAAEIGRQMQEGGAA